MKPYLFASGWCVALIILGILARPRASLAEPVGPGGAGSQPARVRHAEIVGTSACAGSACHAREQPRAEGKIRQGEYLLWNQWDPHAHAYHTLEGQKAKAIVGHLGWTGGQAAKESRCLVCHTDPSLAIEPARDSLRVHGVGCESCHGPAERWLAPHHAATPPRREELEQLGMRNLGEPSTLAAVCAGCHVGAPAHAGQPAREVAHDLLAAGHPRLNFELTVFLANLPPHWNVQKKAQTRGSDFEARAWAAGQVMAARASLQLLAYQASRDSPWPEFAAHDCEACHTPLHSRTRPSGKTLPMSRWAFALLDEVGAQLPRPAPGARRVADHLKELEDLLESPRRNPGQIAAKAGALEAELAAWGRPLQRWKCDPASLMKRIARHAPSDSWNWEEATQRYLALSALEQVRHTGISDEPHRRIHNEVMGLAEKLAFPPSFSGPKEFSEDRLLDHFRRIREQLGE